MINFPITLNNQTIMSNEIADAANELGCLDDVIFFITERTGCTQDEARTVLTELLEMEKGLAKGKAFQSNELISNNGITCPYCHSTNVEKITMGKRVVKGWLWGVAAANTLVKEWHCKNCKSNF